VSRWHDHAQKADTLGRPKHWLAKTGHNVAQAEYNRLATLLRRWALKSPSVNYTRSKFNRSSARGADLFA
jgi:hypothetical protein